MGHPASTFYAASLQFLLPQAASTWHFRYSDVVFSSPDKEKHVLPYPECFSRDHFPSLSLSPHCCLHQFSSHTFVSNISLLSLVLMLPSLILTLSIVSHSLQRYRFQLPISLGSLPLSLNSQTFQQAFSCFPTATAFLLHFIFLCVNFSVPPLSDLTPVMQNA